MVDNIQKTDFSGYNLAGAPINLEIVEKVNKACTNSSQTISQHEEKKVGTKS